MIERTRARRGLTMTDLLAVMAIGASVLGALLPALGEARERANRVKCGSNLRQVALASILYANDNRGAFPRTYFSVNDAGSPVAFTGVKVASPFKDGGPQRNDVSAPMYLLLRTQDITSDVFICPSSKATALPVGKDGGPKEPVDWSNFPGLENLSIAYNNPYPTKNAIMNGWRFGMTSGSEDPLAGDIGPGAAAASVKPDSPAAEMAKANSPNHGGEGQNVAYCDGHVEWVANPFAGAKVLAADSKPTDQSDNIYARNMSAKDAAGDPVMGGATDPRDSILLPAADYKPAATTKPATP